jgi:phospholipid transport system substrate-binding protein
LRARIASRSPARPGRKAFLSLGAPLAACTALLLLGVASPAVAQEPAPAAAPSDAAASAAIEKLHETLLGVMKEASALGFSGRLERIRPVLLGLYDFPFMAEKSVGLGWRDLDEAARARLVDAFSRLAIATYAARFDRYDGARFETLGVQPASAGTLLVKTRIVRGNGETVALDYRMRPESGQWRIVDVFLNGTVSELALRRSEYSGVLKRQGFEALLEAIEQKIAAQERGAQEA